MKLKLIGTRPIYKYSVAREVRVHERIRRTFASDSARYCGRHVCVVIVWTGECVCVWMQNKFLSRGQEYLPLLRV